MALVTTQVVVGTSAVLLATVVNASILIRNMGTAVVYVGPAGVTTATGTPLNPGLTGAAGDSVSFDVAGAAFYGVSGSAAQTVSVVTL